MFRIYIIELKTFYFFSTIYTFSCVASALICRMLSCTFSTSYLFFTIFRKVIITATFKASSNPYIILYFTYAPSNFHLSFFQHIFMRLVIHFRYNHRSLKFFCSVMYAQFFLVYYSSLIYFALRFFPRILSHSRNLLIYIKYLYFPLLLVRGLYFYPKSLVIFSFNIST